MKNYGAIGSFRLLNIKVIWEDNDVLYQGMIEDAPEQIKRLNYAKIDMGDPITLYTYREIN